MLATSAAARTITGMSCVMVVSRSWPIQPGGSGKVSLWLSFAVLGAGSSKGGLVVVVIDVGPRVDVKIEVTIVRERSGMLFFFVRRMEALVAESAERRARWR